MKYEEIVENIREIASNITMIPDFDVDEHAIQAGMDSLDTIQLILAVKEKFSVDLDLVHFITKGTIRTLADEVAEKMP